MVAMKRKSRTKKRGDKSKGKALDDNSYKVSGISDGAIRRLARRGGIKRIAEGVYSEIRTIFTRFVDKLATDSYNYCECAKRKTILPIDVIYALKRQGRNLYGYVYDNDVTGHLGVTHDEEEGSKKKK
uniref:Histone H4 n=1 Tax=Euplotoides octocarinatus TaxID=2716877 RepID=H6V006_EUPOC|nr:histone H4B [Euplotes octocarinatus]